MLLKCLIGKTCLLIFGSLIGATALYVTQSACDSKRKEVSNEQLIDDCLVSLSAWVKRLSILEELRHEDLRENLQFRRDQSLGVINNLQDTTEPSDIYKISLVTKELARANLILALLEKKNYSSANEVMRIFAMEDLIAIFVLRQARGIEPHWGQMQQTRAILESNEVYRSIVKAQDWKNK